MTKAQDVVDSLEITRIHAIPELLGRSDASDVVGALVEGGITCIEILLPSQKGIDLLSRLIREFGAQAHIGAGSVIHPEFAKRVLDAGAAMVVTPGVFPDVVEAAITEGGVVMCGAFTPTECVQAARTGAQLVKLFPVNALGHGALRTMLVPLPDLRIVAAGAVSATSAPQYINAGAWAVAVGYYLVGSREQPLAPIAIVERAKLLLDAVGRARSGRLD